MITAEPDTIHLLDFAPDLQCEGESHKAGTHGHLPESPGTHAVISPCCGHRAIQCAPRVAALRFAGTIHCRRCDLDHASTAYRFERI